MWAALIAWQTEFATILGFPDTHRLNCNVGVYFRLRNGTEFAKFGDQRTVEDFMKFADAHKQ